MSVYNLFKPSLLGRAEAVGLELDGVDYQFGEIERRSNRLANRLLEDGLKPGDRVAAYLKNSLEMIEAYLATVKAGLIFTPVNVLYRSAEIEHILTDAEPKVPIRSKRIDRRSDPSR